MAYLKSNRAADSGLFVVESLRQHKDTVHENFVAKWKEKRPEEEPPRVDLLIDFMADDLDDALVAMIGDLEHYLVETSGDGVDRTERAAAVKEMSSWYQFARDPCVNACGPDKARELGFDLVTEQHPWRLVRQVERAMNCFGKYGPDERIPTPDPRKAEAAPRAGYLVEVLKGPHERLTNVLKQLLNEARRSDSAFIRKEKSFKVFVEKFSVYAKCSEMLYRWAGLEEEAKRIKPSTRRPGQRAEADSPDSGEGSEETEPDTAPAPSEP